MKKYRTILFDLDGTLLNTLDDLASSVNATLTSFRLPGRTTEEVRRFVGNGVEKLMERAVPEGKNHPQFAQILGDFKAYYAQHNLVQTKPYAGIPELLRSLKNRGYKTAVVSNKFDQAVKNLAQIFFPHSLDVALGEKGTVPKKPAPEMIFEAIRLLYPARFSRLPCSSSVLFPSCSTEIDANRLNFSFDEQKAGDRFGQGDKIFEKSPDEGFFNELLSQTIYVGDSDVDIETARNAKIDHVIVSWGFRTREELLPFHPQKMVHSLEELQQFLT